MATALITGAARRIGRSIAMTLAEQGWNIAIHYNRSRTDASELAQELSKSSIDTDVFQADLNNDDDLFQLIPRVLARFPDLDTLINNASIFERANLQATDTDRFDRHWRINFRAPYFLTRNFAKHGSALNVINLLDTKIAHDQYMYSAYLSSKKALRDFTRSAAKELAPRIRVNGICPGPILPPPGKDESYLDDVVNHVPLQRSGTPEEIAQATYFLLTVTYITGQVIFVDGGQHLN